MRPTGHIMPLRITRTVERPMAMRRPKTNSDLAHANAHADRLRKQAERDARERQQRREKAHRRIALRRRQRREWRLARNLVANGVVS